MTAKLKMRMAAITNDPLYLLACKDLAALSNQLVAQKETCDSMMFIQLVLTDLIRARFGDADAKAFIADAMEVSFNTPCLIAARPAEGVH